MMRTINHELTNNTILEKPPLAVEILGPAGAGKTTLARALSERHEEIQPDIPLSRIDKIPFFISNTVIFLPTFLRQYRHSSWFDWRESRSMAYLEAALHGFAKQGSNNDMVTLLDHGPIYRLAFLREFGPEITTSELYERWWASLLDQWIATLDVVIWLDAPNEVLLERIRARDRSHTIKEQHELDAFEYLTRYRTSFEQIIAEFVTEGQVKLLRFDTNQESVPRIVDKVLSIFDFAPKI
jgi:adenylate kinase family enzyme